ncbi:hypothetical protein GCM10023168_23380 [Fodinibacter luteus]|uniref:Uncharacterized protein n=1 Tax=Fodinibacter luteus TaxID=552064 RepID=A0ABP8KIU5_9MICO
MEAQEVAELPERAPSREPAAVLHANPVLRRFLIAARHPAGEEALQRASNLAVHGSAMAR